jgi:hypothetical protein
MGASPCAPTKRFAAAEGVSGGGGSHKPVNSRQFPVMSKKLNTHVISLAQNGYLGGGCKVSGDEK